MNKIFKVVWSKTKECYVVVSEVAKNNSGKKKVLASVLAALAVVGAGTAQVDAAASFGAGGGTAAGDASISIGGGYPGPKTKANSDFAIAIGDNASATGKSSISMGYKAETNGQVSIAIGEESKVKKSEGTAVGPGAVVEERFGAAFGHEAKATKQYATAIGSGAQGEGEDSQAIGRQAQTTGYRAVAVGTLAKALNNSAVAIGEKSVADGTNSIAMGKMSKAHSFDAIAIGHNNNSRTYSAISIGTDNTSDVAYGLTDAQFDALPYDENNINDPNKTDPRRGVSSTIAIGRNNLAGNVEAIAIGTETKATKTDAIAIGARAEATGDYALAIGGAAGGFKVTADEYGTAVGVRANAANRGAAFGAGSNAGAQKSVAIGYTANASAQKATSNYEFSGSHGTPSPAGYNTETITVNSASAPAGGAVAGNYYDAGSAVAIGDGATVSDESDRAVVVGAGAKTNGNAHYSVVLGSGSHADASDGFVAGHGSSVASRESIAIGSGANVSGTENIRSQAIGFGATVSGTKAYDATAIGATAQVSGVQGGVALGSGSLLSRTTASNENIGWNSKYVDGTVVRNRAYKAKVNALDQWDAGAQIGAVSVGNDTQKRQIINVAAGNQDTDAVNVAQLKNVGVRVGADTNTATIGTNKVAADFLAYNGQLNIKGDNNRVTTVSENDANGKDANVNVKFDYNGLVKAKTGSAVKVDQKTDAAGKTYFEIDAAAGGATSTESVVKKAAATNDTNIADISVADNKNTGDVGAKYEVSVSRNAVKDAAREAVTVNNGGTTKADGSYTADSNNPISVTPTKDDTNHNTSYAVTFDGNKAAKQIPLTYKANGNGAKTVTLEKGLNFTNGTNTTAEIDNDGVVKYNLNKDVDLTNAGSLTVGGTKVNNDGITIKAPTTPGTTTTDVKLTNTGLDNGGNKITNVAEGTNNTDAVNVKQLKKNRTEVKAGDNVVVTSAVDATDNHTVYTVNAVTPAVYTTPDGTKLTKDKDGKFHKEGESTEYTGDIITSFENPKAATGQTTKDGGMIVNNVGSAIKNQTGATYLDKLKAAADDNSNVKNAVVNVSDLKNTSDALIDKGLKFDANEGGVKTNKLGSTVTVQGSGALTAGKAYADEYNTANIRTKIEQGTDGNTTINVGLAKALKDINSISNGNSSITLNSNPGGTGNTPAVSITGGNVDVGGNNITNLKSGGDTDSNAANIGDVKKIASDTDTHIKPGTYTVAADKTVTMTYVNGKGETVKANGQDVVAKIDLSGLPTGGTSSTEKVQKAADATGDKNIAEVGPKSGDTFGAADATYEVSVSRNAVKDAAREAVTVNNGGTTKADGSYTADSNNPISVTPTKDDNNHNTSYAVTFDGNKAAKQIPLTYKATNGTTTTADQTVKLDKGLNFTGGNYTTASVGADGKVTFDVNLGTTPTVTDGKPGVPGQDGIATVKTVVDTINNSGWKANAKANGGKLDGSATATVVKPGNTVNYAAGKNLIVNQELEKDASNALTGNQTYTYSLNKDIDLTNAGSLTVGDTTVNNGGITIKAPTPAAGTTATTTDVKLTNTGLDNGGNTITNVAEGQNNTDAVNVKQLKANRTEVKAGDNVVVTSDVDSTDSHTVYTVNAVTPAVYTTPDGTKLTKDKDGKFHKEGETAEYTGNIITSFENPKAATGQTTKDGGMIVNNIGSAIKNQTPTMPAGQTATYLDKLKAAADDNSNVKNAAVNVSDLHNTAEALRANELHIAPTAVKANSTEVKGGELNTAGTENVYKYDASTKKVTLTYNDGNGKAVTDTKAVIDFSALNTGGTTASTWTAKTSAENTTAGSEVGKHAGNDSQVIGDQNSVDFQAGRNMIVKQTNDGNGNTTINYALDKDLTNLDKVVVNGKDGIAGKDGVTIVGPQGATGAPGISGTNGIDGKVGISGKDGKDAVSISGKDGVGHIGLTGPQGPQGPAGTPGTPGANIDISTDHGTQTLVKPEANNNDKSERIVYVPKDSQGNPLKDTDGKNIVREVATMDDGLKFGGDMGTVGAVKLNKQVDVKGGITDTNKLATGNNIGVTSVPDTTTGNTALNIQLAKDLTGLNSVELGGNTIKTDGDHITITTPSTTPGGNATVNKVANLGDELHITPGTYEVGAVDKDANAKNDEVTLTYTDGNSVEKTNTFAKIKGVANSNLSNISNDGKKVITGLSSVVKAGDNVTVSEKSDATTGQKTYTVNAVTPAVYTKADGTKVYKIVDPTTGAVTWNTSADGNGTPVNANEVIASFETPATGTTPGATTGGTMIVNNIGSAISGHEAKDTAGTVITSPTYLQRLETAAGDNLTKHAAVNVSDLNSAAKELKASELHIAPTAVKSGSTEVKGGVASGTENVYKYDASTKKVTLTYNDGNGKAVTDTKAVIDFSALNTGGTTASTWTAKTSAENTTAGSEVGKHAGNDSQVIGDQNSVDFQAGRNMIVKQTNDGNGNTTINYALDKDLTNLDKVVVNGKDGIAGKDGVTIVGPQGATGAPGISGTNGIDGKVGISGKDGKDAVSISGKDGVGHIGLTGPQGPQGPAGTPGTPGANIDISTDHGTQTLVKPEANNNDKSERIVYVPKDSQGNPLKDTDGKNIVREVATMDDGLKFGGDMGTVGAVKLNKQVDVKGGITDTNKLATGNNIGVTSVPDTTTGNTALNIQLAKDLTGLNSVELGGNTIKTDGDHITITTPSTTPGGNATVNKVANLGDELHITPGTYEVGAVDKDANAKNDEVTLTYTDGNSVEKTNTFAKIKGVANSNLSNISNDGKKVITGLSSVVKAGDNVTVSEKSDATTGQKTYTVNAVTPAVYTKADGTKVYKIVDPTTGAVTWNTSADGNGTPVNANEVIASFETPATGTTPGATTGGTMIVNNIGSAISGHEAKDTAGTVITSPTYLQRLETAAGDNLTKHAAVNVSDLNSAAKELKASELHIAPTEGGTDTDKGGGASGNTNAGAAAQAYKYNAATKQVELTFNNGNGKAVTGPKAVIDFSDLVIPAGGNNYGFNTNAGGNIKDNATTTATAVASGKTVTYAAGKNLTVEQKIGADGNQTYTYALNKDLTNLDKVVVNGKDGIDGKDGVSITGPKGESAPGAKDGQDGKVGIAGKDGKDAVSISGKDGVGHIGLTGPAGAPGAPGTPGANIDISTDHGTQTLVKPEANNNDKSERIVYVPKDANGNPLKDKDNNPIKREVATMDDGLRFTGNNTSKENKQPMNSLVKVQGEGVTENAAGKLEANGQEFKSAAGNIAVVAEKGDTLTVKMNKDLNLTKDGSVTMGNTVVNNDGITIKAPTTPGTTTTDVKLTNQGLDNGGNKITNVAAGTANTDAVNVKQLKDNVTTVTSSDSSIKVVDKNDPTSATYDATKGHQYDITINNQGVVNNAQTPVVYTKEDGTKVYKQPDGTFTTNINGTGTVVPANQVIASMNSAGNSSTDPTKLQNVGSSIADKTGTTFLDKINTAAADPNAKYGAVNVTDLKSTSDALIDKGLVFDANNGEPKTNKLGSKVTIAGTGALGTTENFTDKYNTDNIRTNIKQDASGNTTVEIGLNKNLKGLESVSVPGKDGVDGQDGVSITGKDGANGVDGKVSIGKDGKDAVSISGKDGIGHIGLTGAAGKDGTNTKADITVKEGQPGLNGTDGITRIVYKDKDGNDHEVATHDDGVKYAGDDAQGTDKTKVISKKLNQTIDIVGGADKTKLTDNNIGVNNDGGKLKVQLANELAGINKISNGGSSITFNSNPGGATNTPAVQISGGDLNMGGNKITNVKNGTAPTDAATVGQLTKVEAGDNSVTVAHTTTADGQNVYTIKANPAGTVDLTNVNNRIDQLGEEVGRVGAQGAALSALKPIQYDPLEPTQIMAGYGNYRGNSAVALGVAHYKNESTLIHGGVSWAGGSSHMMANAGVTWKVGNRDSEAAVADRYRKGPISSTYAMQQEMAAMKAQNAGLKGEVSDLKAENEQMKAQIAAMMAKLGL